MRDSIKENGYFEIYSIKINEIIEQSKSRLLNREVPEDNILTVRKNIFWNSLKILISNYSAGIDFAKLQTNFDRSLDLMQNGWDNTVVKFKSGKKPKYLDQYWFDENNHMIWMLSIGILLGVEKSKMKIIEDLIDKGNVVNFIYEYLLNQFSPNRNKSNPRKLTYPPYKYLIAIIEEQDVKKATQMMKQYVTKWYTRSKKCYWYDTHNNQHNTYFGYWCFEAAAVTCIKGLDDSSYRDHPYYPKDLADYYRANQ